MACDSSLLPSSTFFVASTACSCKNSIYWACCKTWVDMRWFSANISTISISVSCATPNMLANFTWRTHVSSSNSCFRNLICAVCRTSLSFIFPEVGGLCNSTKTTLLWFSSWCHPVYSLLEAHSSKLIKLWCHRMKLLTYNQYHSMFVSYSISILFFFFLKSYRISIWSAKPSLRFCFFISKAICENIYLVFACFIEDCNLMLNTISLSFSGMVSIYVVLLMLQEELCYSFNTFKCSSCSFGERRSLQRFMRDKGCHYSGNVDHIASQIQCCSSGSILKILFLSLNFWHSFKSDLAEVTGKNILP